MPGFRHSVLAASAAGFLAAVISATAGAAEPDPGPQPPSAALTAAAERWKLARAAERAAQPGAAGRHDLFWEILKLWEKDEKSRADPDLAAVMNWLLFDAGLAADQNLADPVYGRLPTLSPAIGEKLLDRRVSEWLATVGAGGGGGREPWLWPEFPGMDGKALAASARRVMESGPRSNPVVRIWLAALLVAADDPKGIEELAAAQAGLTADLPSRAEHIGAAVTESLCRGGVKGSLTLLLNQAEAGLTATADAPAERPEAPNLRPQARILQPLYRFYQMVGWSTRRLQHGRTDPKAEITGARAWLKANLAALTWNATLKRFTGGTPQPGTEKLAAAAAAVEKKWNLALLDRLTSGQLGAGDALAELAALAERSPEAAADATVAELAGILAGDDAPDGFSYEAARILPQLQNSSPDLGAVFLRSWLRGALLAGDARRLRAALRMSPDTFKVLDAACAGLVPEFEKFHTEAAASGDAEKAATALMAWLFVGGRPDFKTIGEALRKVPASWGGYDANSRLGTWAAEASMCGRTGGLRLWLAMGRTSLSSYREKGALHPIRQFERYAGWREQFETPPGTAEEELAQGETWLEMNEAALRWDQERQRFTGVPRPGLEALAESAAAAGKRYALDTAGVLTCGKDAARKLFSEIFELMRHNPDAAKDPQLGELVLVLLDPGRMDDDQVMRERLYVQLPKLNRELGVKVWAAFIRRSLVAAAAENPGRAYSSPPPDLLMPAARLKGLDISLIPEACKRLAEEFSKRYQESAKAPVAERLPLAVACLYVGGKVDAGEVDALVTEAGKLGPIRIALFQWGEAIVRSGNPAGLSLLLTAARQTRTSCAYELAHFDYLAGRSPQQFDRRYDRMDENALSEQLDSAAKWLAENGAKLVFDPAGWRFRAPSGQAVERPDPPGPGPRPRPRPVPPDPPPEVF